MIPGSFEYHRPQSVADAVGLLSSLGEDAFVVAGGHSLIPMMKLRMSVPDALVDLRDIASLKSISINGASVELGAMVTQSEIIASNTLAQICPLMREVALQIADPQIRNVGTIGGNVANGDPGNDMPAIMLALNATYVLEGPSGAREVPARDFYQAAYFTGRAEDEILTSVKFEAPSAGHGSAYLKQKRKIGDYATAAAAVIISMSGGKVVSASISLTNLSDTPLFAGDAANILVGSSLDHETITNAINAAKAITEPAADGRGPVEFKTHVAGIMVERAILQAASKCA